MCSIEPIGYIHSPYTTIENMPIQPKGAMSQKGQVVVDEKYVDGLEDLDGFSHIYLFYIFHKVIRTELQVTPFMDTQSRGVFATRSPLRPNHIGLSIVELVSVANNVLTIQGVDVVDGTPLLDIKPYIDQFDRVAKSTSGWLEATDNEIRGKRSDKRFE